MPTKRKASDMLLPICTIMDQAYLDQISTTQLGLDWVDEDEDGDTIKPGTLNQRSFMGLPQVWQPDDTEIECNLTAPAIEEAAREDGIQIHSQEGEFEDIDEDEWAQIVAMSGV